LRAHTHLELSQVFYARADARDFLPELHHHFAAAPLRVAAYERAVEHARQALTLARGLAMHVEEATSLRLLGEIALPWLLASIYNLQGVPSQQAWLSTWRGSLCISVRRLECRDWAYTPRSRICRGLSPISKRPRLRRGVARSGSLPPAAAA